MQTSAFSSSLTDYERALGSISQLGSDDAAKMFALAPVPLWVEDYSGLKSLFDQWRAAGIADLRAYLLENPSRIEACSRNIRVLEVNQATLALFKAGDLNHLVANLHKVFRNDMFKSHIDELVQLWTGQPGFASNTVNYSLEGRRLDIQLKGSILPGYEDDWGRVLVSTEDVTERENALRLLATRDTYARGLFEHSPVSLWVEDFSGVKRLLEDLRGRGIEDFRTFMDVHPEFVSRCMSEIRVIDVNRHTLQLFGAPDKATLLRHLPDIFRDAMHRHFGEQLVDLWSGKLFQQREVVNYAMNGTELHLHMQFSVLPGHEDDWSQVQVALTDITARKKAEAYLEFLGRHDVLTKLCNRAFYVDEISRLERRGVHPVSVIMVDLNGLKRANDRDGHARGDSLLRRVGEILAKAVDLPCTAARIGGDEFAILMPHAGAREAEAMVDSLNQITDLNNQFHIGSPLSLSVGFATNQQGERLEAVARRADLAMYDSKREHYALAERNRREADDGAEAEE